MYKSSTRSILCKTQSWTGGGVYLGKGLVTTATHLVGAAARTKPSVRIAGMDLPATYIREGNFERVDLTLVSIDWQKLPISLRMRRIPCVKSPCGPGGPVIVAAPEGTASSHIMSPQLLPINVRRKFSKVISEVATTGDSWSGVFDAGNKCVLGIMSRKIYVPSKSSDAGIKQDIAKYFVRASAIRAFIQLSIASKGDVTCSEALCPKSSAERDLRSSPNHGAFVHRRAVARARYERPAYFLCRSLD